MKQATFLLVLLFYFNIGCFSNPIVDDFDKIRYWVYKYEGQIEARNSDSNETLSKWTVSGKLSAYNSLKHAVLKLDDVKTSLFNGERSNFKNVHEKDIPLESKALLLPFKLKSEGDDFNIYFEPSDPLWSRNFKRGIASTLHVDVNKASDDDLEYFHIEVKEKSIHGLCEVSYDINENKETNTTVYQKTIKHESCTELPEKRLTNIKRRAVGIKGLEPERTKTIKTATFRLDNNGVKIPFEMVSTSNIIIRTMPSTLTTQHLDQHQKFELISQSEVLDEPDFSKVTDRHSLIYEATIDPTSGRHVYETDTDALVKLYLDNYDSYMNYFLESPVQNIDMSSHDQIDNMFLALLHFKAEGFEALEQAFKTYKNYTDDDEGLDEYHRILDMYYALLPYIGTDEFVKYLIKNIDYVSEYGFNKWGSREMAATKILAFFPNFLQNPSEKLLKDLEIFLNIKNPHQRSARNAGVLSYASIVAQVYNKVPSIPKVNFNKYIELFYGKFVQSENYEERMTYLLGLVNMADILDVDFINNIITNTSESQHIRTLAITGFKSRLSYEDTKIKNLYKTYWHIVQNKKEPFEVRVAALDLLLTLRLTDEQLNTMVKKYSLHFNDPQERHLANYLLTSLHSLQNTTLFYDNLGDLSFAALKNNHIPFFPKSFTTGNYRLSNTDEDIGCYLQTRLTVDPATNAFKLAQISYSSYGFSYNMGEYTVYLKMDGVMENAFAELFLKSLKDVSSVPELLKMLKEGNFELKEIERDIHVDIVVFLDDVAVYALHIGKWDKKELHQFLNDVMQYIDRKMSVKYPLVDYKHIPTDLGTPLQISHLVEDITFLNFLIDIFHYRSTWNYQAWIESYNPLIDTNIASYKYIGSEKLLKFNNTFDDTKLQLTWLTKEDSFIVNWDNTVGTYVESEELLKQYCEECRTYISPEFEFTFKSEKNLQALGFELHNFVSVSDMNSYPRNDLTTFLGDIRYEKNVDSTPYAWPILFFNHFFTRKVLIYDELSSGVHKFLPYWKEDMESTATINYDGNFKKIFNPMIQKDYEFEIDVKHKLLESDNISCAWNLNLYYLFEPQHINEVGGKDIHLTQTINLKYVSSNESDSKHVCIRSDASLPFIKGDKYSLQPVEPTTTKMVYKVSQNADDKTCENSVSSFECDEIYSPTDKNEKLQNRQNKKDYEECLQNSKDLKFVAPSSACRRISSELAEYGNYQTFFTVKKANGEDYKIRKPAVEYSRLANDYIKFAIAADPKALESDYSYINTTLYYPRTILNPIGFAYGDQESGVPSLPFLITSTCTISPSTVELFSGKFVPNQEESWIAFAECYNTTTRGLKGRSVGNNHVEFEYYSKENALNVEYKDGKAHLKLNGKELTESYDPNPKSDEMKVYFIDDNVFYVYDHAMMIYYNTEYVQVTINSLHSKILCGMCTKDQ